MPSSASFKNFAKSPRGQGCPRSLFNHPCRVALASQHGPHRTPALNRGSLQCGICPVGTSRCIGPRTVPVRSGLSGPKTSGFSRTLRPAHALRTGTVHGPLCVGPRTVPVRSRLSGPKTSGFSRTLRPAHALRTGTVRGPSEAQDAVVIAKSRAAPRPVLGVSDQIRLGRIVLDVTPSLQFVFGVAHECVPVIVRPKLAAAAQRLVRLARCVLL